MGNIRIILDYIRLDWTQIRVPSMERENNTANAPLKEVEVWAKYHMTQTSVTKCWKVDLIRRCTSLGLLYTCIICFLIGLMSV